MGDDEWVGAEVAAPESSDGLDVPKGSKEEDGVPLSAHSKEVAKGSFWGFAGSISYKLVSFIYTVMIARVASQDDVGLFLLTLGIITFPIILGDLGLPGSLLRYVPFFQGKKEPGKIRSLMRYSYPIVAGASVIFASLMWVTADMIGSFFQNPALPGAIRFLSAFVLLNGIFRINYSFLQGLADIKTAQLLLNLDNLFKLIFTLVLFHIYGNTALMMMAGFVLSHLAVTLISFVAIRRDYSKVPDSGDVLRVDELVREILPFGLMLSLVNSLNFIMASSDRVILGYLTPPAAAATTVAIYGISTTLASVLIIFPSSIGSIFLPVISRLAGKGDIDSIRGVLETAQRWAIFVTLPVALVLIVFSSEILGALYGADYSSGGAVLSIFTLGILINSISMLVALALAAMRVIKIELNISIVGAILNIILNILFIPLLGMEGAALASAIGFLIVLLLLLHYGWKLFRFRLPSGIFKIFLAGVITLIILTFAKPYLFVIVGMIPHVPDGSFAEYFSKITYLGFLGFIALLTLCIFCASSVILKCFGREDVGLLRRVLERSRLPKGLISMAEKLVSMGISSSAR